MRQRRRSSRTAKILALMILSLLALMYGAIILLASHNGANARAIAETPNTKVKNQPHTTEWLKSDLLTKNHCFVEVVRVLMLIESGNDQRIKRTIVVRPSSGCNTKP